MSAISSCLRRPSPAAPDDQVDAPASQLSHARRPRCRAALACSNSAASPGDSQRTSPPPQASAQTSTSAGRARASVGVGQISVATYIAGPPRRVADCGAAASLRRPTRRLSGNFPRCARSREPAAYPRRWDTPPQRGAHICEDTSNGYPTTRPRGRPIRVSPPAPAPNPPHGPLDAFATPLLAARTVPRVGKAKLKAGHRPDARASGRAGRLPHRHRARLGHRRRRDGDVVACWARARPRWSPGKASARAGSPMWSSS